MIAGARFRRGAVAGTLLLAIVFAGHAAGADPIADKKAEAEKLAGQIQVLGDKQSALAERFNQATLNSQRVQLQVDAAKTKLQAAQSASEAARGRLRDVAVSAYVRGASGDARAASVVDAVNPAVASVYSGVVTAGDTDALDQLRATTLQLHEQQAQLASAQQAAQAAMSTINARRADVVNAERQLRGTLSTVKGQLSDLVAQAEAERRAADAAHAAALARTAVERVSRSRPALSVAAAASEVSASPPPVGSGAAAAVAEALRQVGKPYVWAAAGPDAFDCSGLTLWAWRAAGVSLPHYTGAQYAATTHISLADLQPGDLVYNASMGHMAMYIGNGNMVEAPHSGALVRVVPLRSDLVLASRP